MSVKQLFDAVKTRLLTDIPTLQMELTAEVKEFHGTPPRVIWFYPEFGQEDISLKNVNIGQPVNATNDGVIGNRMVTCQIHVWLPALTDSNGIEYCDDNCNPAEGDVWLPNLIMAAIHDEFPIGKAFGKAGFLPRTAGNMGFTYVFECSFDLPVYRVKRTGTATIKTYTQTGSYQ